MKLTELVDAMTLPETRAAEQAWDLAGRRIRRRRTAGAVAAVITVVLAVAVVPLVRDRGETSSPPITTPTSEPPAGPYVPAELITRRWDAADYAAAAAGAPRLAVTDPVPLSTNPVDRATLAVVPQAGGRGDDRWTTIDVLGDDGGWRSLDVAGIVPVHDTGGYESYPLAPTSLSSDGTRLALAQPGAVVVVDLTTGGSQRYDVPGLPTAASWGADDHILVFNEGRETLQELDPTTGQVSGTDLDPSTRVLPDGTPVTWGSAGYPDSHGVFGDTGIQRTVPLVGEDVVVQLSRFSHMVSDGIAISNAVAVVDRHTGEALGVRSGSEPGIEFTHLLAVDDHSVLMSVIQPDSTDRLLVRWDWVAHTTDVLAVLPAAMASYAGTVDEAATMLP